MKRFCLIVIALALTFAFPAGGQNHVERAMRKAREKQERMASQELYSDSGGGEGILLRSISGDDTTYYDTIDPIWIFGRGHSNIKDWKKYYRLVYNFARVYPYAKASRRLQEIVDSTIAAENMSRAKKEKYIAGIQKMLFKDFEGALHNMTISQGAVLLKLIDRETGKSSYSVIKDYKSGIAAGFWQGIAKMFDNDLKSEYDPEGADANIEELVRMWEDGSFSQLYYSIFWESPPEIPVPDFYKEK